jgi:Cof subfamily protein (haloacid dehalogenase superfamily)
LGLLEVVSVVPVPVELLVLDVDGTVTDSQHAVTSAAHEAVRMVEAAGIRVVLATGRRYRDVLPVAQELGLTGPLITASGGLVKQPVDHQTLFRASFAPDLLPAILSCIVAAGHEPVIYTDSYAGGFDFYCRTLTAVDAAGKPSGFGEYLARNRELARVEPALVSQPPAEAFAGFAMGPVDEMERLEATLAKQFAGSVSLHTIQSPRYRDWLCEIAPAGVDKWSSVRRLASRWGIPVEAICAVGDDRNDLPMIRGAGLGVAMGNAREEVQRAADRVVASHEAGGLVEVAAMLTGD